jgi:hypothetical protein
MNHPALKTRILLPAAALLGVLFAGFLYMTWTFQCNDLHSDFSAILESGKRVIAEKTETDARLLAGAIDDLTHNERMLALWRQRDRAGLQQLAEPLFTALRISISTSPIASASFASISPTASATRSSAKRSSPPSNPAESAPDTNSDRSEP